MGISKNKKYIQKKSNKNKKRNFLVILITGFIANIHSINAIAANNETNITVGLTCGIIGWNNGKWEDISTNNGYLNSPWYTGEKGGINWTENENNKASRIWSDKYFDENSVNWVRFTYFSDELSRAPRTMVRHHRWKNVTSSQFTWTDDDRDQRWAQYLDKCSTKNGIPDIGPPSHDIETLAKDIVIEVINTSANNYKMALNFLPKSIFATGGKSLQSYQVDLTNVVQKELQQHNSDKPTAWLKGFSGINSPFQFKDTDHGEYGNWNSRHKGLLLGGTYKTESNEIFSIFGNHGEVNVDFQDQGGGEWRPTGSGFGMAIGRRFDKTNAGLVVSKTSFSGQHRRGLIPVGDFIGGSAKGNKSTTSYAASLKIRRQHEINGFLISPEISGTWNHNIDHAWEETGGVPFDIKYSNYSDNFLLTSIAIKLSKESQLSENYTFRPSIKTGWLADWDLNNQPARIRNIKNNQTISIAPDQKNEHGLLLEGTLKLTPTTPSHSRLGMDISYGIRLWEATKKDNDWQLSLGLSYQFE
tara:strand:+ start:78 stop:1664 length:1587 start_codon:yes stop_codon:yes gene_type:complete